MNGKAATVSVFGFGLMLGALITRNAGLAWMALPFVTYLAAGILRSPYGEEIRLTARREVSFSQIDDACELKVCVTVRNEGANIGRLTLADSLHLATSIVEGELQHRTSLAPGESTHFEYVLRAERGEFHWKTLHAAVSDSLGLVQRNIELSAPAEVSVLPPLRKYKAFPLRPESTLHSPGLIPARASGSGTDFWGVRDFRSGDSLRRVDWRRTARHPYQYFTKEFEREEIADIGLILDARPETNVHSGNDNLFEHTLQAAASLSEVFLRRGNRAALLVAGGRMSIVYPGYGRIQLNRILRCLAAARVGTEDARFNLDSLSLQVFGRRALIIVLSPLRESDQAAFPRLRSHGNQVLLICPDTIDFKKQELRDQAGLLAVRAARLQRLLELRRIARSGVRVIDWQVQRPLQPLVRDALRRWQSPRR